MLIAEKELHVDRIKTGQWVYLYQDAARLLSVELQQLPGLEDYEAPAGLYLVSNTEEKRYGNMPVAKHYPKKAVTVHYKTWDPAKENGIMIVYTQDSQVLLAGGHMFMCDTLFQVFRNIDELVEANEGQWYCASCGHKLTIPIGHMRVCGPCEKKLEMKKG